MEKRGFLFVAFGCIGTTTEIYFTALSKLFSQIIKKQSLDFKFEGKSYIWMFFIYGITAYLFPIIYSKVSRLNIFLRLLIYALIIFTIEFITGAILDLITGSCPWNYTSGLSILGYIRLDYIFFWMGFGFAIEKTFLFLTKLTEKGLSK